MQPFRLLSEDEILGQLSTTEHNALVEFQAYLCTIRVFGKTRDNVSIDEAYNTAWRLGFVDFQKTTIPNLYGIEYGKEYRNYQDFCRFGLERTAQIKWLMKFNGEVVFPENPAMWDKKWKDFK